MININSIKAALVGHPNVGKSTILNDLTGLTVEVSNYPGTTVEIFKAKIKKDDTNIIIIDTPGMFSIVPTSVAEDVARRIIIEGELDVIVHIVDATSLSRHLYLTLELMEFGIPLILVVNQMDRAKQDKITIEREQLEKILQLPVIFTVATKKTGVELIVEKLLEISQSTREVNPKILSEDVENFLLEIEKNIINKLENNKLFSRPIANCVVLKDDRYSTLSDALPDSLKENLDEMGKSLIMDRVKETDIIAKECTKISPMERKFLKKIDYIAIKPIYGILLTALILLVIIAGITGIVKGVGYRFSIMAYNNFYEPMVRNFVYTFIHDDFLRNILVGDTPEFLASLGLLTTGVYFVILMIPMMFLLYLIIGFLEDVGIIPRLTISFDRTINKIGVSGEGVIPLVTGVGCSIVGVLSSRTLKTDKERFMVSVLQVFGIPCIAQNVMIWYVLGEYGLLYVLLSYVIFFISLIIVGLILNKIIPGEKTYLLLELPAWRKPQSSNVIKKTVGRIKAFLLKSTPLILLGILIVNILYYTGLIGTIASFLSPIVCGLFKLPEEVAGSLIIGILRKDIAIGILGMHSLSPMQALTAVVIITLYFPCIAAFLVILSEFKIKKALLMVAIMLPFTLIVGSLLGIISIFIY